MHLEIPIQQIQIQNNTHTVASRYIPLSPQITHAQSRLGQSDPAIHVHLSEEGMAVSLWKPLCTRIRSFSILAQCDQLCKLLREQTQKINPCSVM